MLKNKLRKNSYKRICCDCGRVKRLELKQTALIVTSVWSVEDVKS